MSVRRLSNHWLGAALALLVGAAPLAAQVGTVTGTVRTEGGELVAGVQVTVQGTALGALSNQNGRFIINQVPVGTQEVQAQLIGYGTQTETVLINEGETASVEFILSQEAVALSGIVVTGVIGATEQAKLPFTVDQLNTADIPVPAVNPVQALQGKVAGASVVAGSGRPGATPSILLRGATSIDASGRNQEPLYIVDGVILGSDITDISSLDVESIEVVKGAAAASLYGSRAANGVIQITTKRGRGMSTGEVRYTFRSELGSSELPGEFLLAKQHPFALNSSGDMFVDANTGQACAWLDFGSVDGCSTPALAGQQASGGTPDAWNTIQSNPWPGGARDQVATFFTGGNFMENYLSATGRQGATNFHVSLSNTQNEGVMPGKEGYERTSFRLNVDQSVRENLQVSASASYSVSEEDVGEGQLFDLTRMPAGVDLTACEDDPETPENERQQSCYDDPDNLLLVPNPINTESPNPLYQMLVEEDKAFRGRFLGSGNLRWSPVDWFDVAANASYDRLDSESENFYRAGYRTIDPSDLNDGYLYKYDFLSEAINASVTATGRFSLGENIRNRTQIRYLYERDDNQFNWADGYNFAVADVPTLSNLQDRERIRSGSQSIRSDGYFAITNFDIMDRYIIDALFRNDGSSLFGEDERRQWYYRVGGAWRVGREPWFNLPVVNELKLRYSLGTAGGRPTFAAQYETYGVSGGFIVPQTLGNAELKPEFSTEQELAIEALFLDGRLGASLVYANTVTEDQILRVPAPGYVGFDAQWKNAGTLESDTWEATLDARIIDQGSFSWNSRLLWDQTTSTITALNTSPFQYGVGGQGLGTVFYAREGEELGTFYGVQAATSCDQLPEGTDCSQFATNDEGFFVYTGGAGLDDGLWGCSSLNTDTGDECPDNALFIAGAPVNWGIPIAGVCQDRATGETTAFCPVGNTVPDYNIGFSNTIRWGGLSLYALLESVQGFDIYNQPLQWAVFRRSTSLFDQGDVPEAERKPIGYFDGLYGVSGLQPSSIFVEDGSYTKLREVSLAYRLDAEMLSRLGPLAAFRGITLSATGRNLVTWTDYRGYDPEVGESGGDTGSAALARVDGYQYPNFRTLTLGVEVDF